MKPIFALVDCNNFFVSCERVFQPELRNVPAIVLSNNDGCVIARSNEAKALGIKMAEPVFKIRDLLERYSVKMRSTNFALYGDMSDRVMEVARQFTPMVEVYSIDEAFMRLDEVRCDSYLEYSRKIVERVQKWTGIPVSIGVAHTKVLAKVATEIVKSQKIPGAVVDLTAMTEAELDEALSRVEVGDIWGVGRRSALLLRSHRIITAKDLKYADIKWIRKKMTVQGERIVLELRGTPCHQLQLSAELRKSVATTRTFAKDVHDYDALKAAVAHYTTIAAQKLRKETGVAHFLTVMIRTNRYRADEFYTQYYSNSTTLSFEEATDYTPDLVAAALQGLDKIYEEGKGYKRAGVILSGLELKSGAQYGMFTSLESDAKMRKSRVNLMRTVDSVNRKWGNDTLKLGAAAHFAKLPEGRKIRSKRYTSSWSEILEIGS